MNKSDPNGDDRDAACHIPFDKWDVLAWFRQSVFVLLICSAKTDALYRRRDLKKHRMRKATEHRQNRKQKTKERNREVNMN